MHVSSNADECLLFDHGWAKRRQVAIVRVNGGYGCGTMKLRPPAALLLVVVVLTFALSSLALFDLNFPLLETKGALADAERDLILLGAGLSLIVVIPVFAMLFGFAWHYREDNHQADYRPQWDHSRLAETIWWGVPLLLIGFLSIVTWEATHRLDPFRPLAAAREPITVQVVAMEWKWLFIYPDHDVATINYLRLPKDTPVSFDITADAPMNSFWIPALGGQMYAMPGMSTKLHLIANENGKYRGQSANLSGEGFADMHFTTEVSSVESFDDWVTTNQSAGPYLNKAVYSEVSKPGESKPKVFAGADADLYATIVNRYHAPLSDITSADAGRGHH